MLVTFGWRMKEGFFILIFEPSSWFLNKDMILPDTKGLGEGFPYSLQPRSAAPRRGAALHMLPPPGEQGRAAEPQL